MTIDALQEELLTLGQAAQHAKPGDRRLAPSTIWRWYRKGIAGVKLETICIGGIRHTSFEALQRFFNGVTAARDHVEKPSNCNGDTGQRSELTEQQLRDAGLC
jgi:hypothetical protein